MQIVMQHYYLVVHYYISVAYNIMIIITLYAHRGDACTIIRESVDSLCRDGADARIT